MIFFPSVLMQFQRKRRWTQIVYFISLNCERKLADFDINHISFNNNKNRVKTSVSETPKNMIELKSTLQLEREKK